MPCFMLQLTHAALNSVDQEKFDLGAKLMTAENDVVEMEMKYGNASIVVFVLLGFLFLVSAVATMLASHAWVLQISNRERPRRGASRSSGAAC